MRITIHLDTSGRAFDGDGLEQEVRRILAGLRLLGKDGTTLLHDGEGREIGFVYLQPTRIEP